MLCFQSIFVAEMLCFQSICVAEMVSRAVKHLYKTYMQGVEAMSLSASISHFLNCYLASYATPQTHLANDEVRGLSTIG